MHENIESLNNEYPDESNVNERNTNTNERVRKIENNVESNFENKTLKLHEWFTDSLTYLGGDLLNNWKELTTEKIIAILCIILALWTILEKSITVICTLLAGILFGHYGHRVGKKISTLKEALPSNSDQLSILNVKRFFESFPIPNGRKIRKKSISETITPNDSASQILGSDLNTNQAQIAEADCEKIEDNTTVVSLSSPRPYLHLKVLGQPVVVLLDTGSSVNVCHHQFLAELQRNASVDLPRHRAQTSLVTYSDNKVQVMFSAIVPFEFEDGRVVQMPVLVVNHPSGHKRVGNKFVLGMAIFSKYKAELLWKESQLYLSFMTKFKPIKQLCYLQRFSHFPSSLEKGVKLKPGQVCSLKCEISPLKNIRTNMDYEVFQIKLQHPGLTPVEEGLITPYKGQYSLKVSNNTSKNIVLGRGTTVGNVKLTENMNAKPVIKHLSAIANIGPTIAPSCICKQKHKLFFLDDVNMTYFGSELQPETQFGQKFEPPYMYKGNCLYVKLYRNVPSTKHWWEILKRFKITEISYLYEDPSDLTAKVIQAIVNLYMTRIKVHMHLHTHETVCEKCKQDWLIGHFDMAQRQSVSKVNLNFPMEHSFPVEYRTKVGESFQLEICWIKVDVYKSPKNVINLSSE